MAEITNVFGEIPWNLWFLRPDGAAGIQVFRAAIKDNRRFFSRFLANRKVNSGVKILKKSLVP